MTNDTRFKAVIFDVGGVIVKLDIHNVLSGISENLFDNYFGNVNGIASDDLIIQYDCGRLSPEEFYEAITDKYGLDMDFMRFANLWCSVFSPMPGMDNLLGELKGRVALGILSDTDPLHWKHMTEEYPILNIIENPTLSYKIGVTKPAAEIYHAAARNVNVEPEDCLYVDDRAVNVEGARRVGMDAIHFKGIELLREEFIKREILED